MTGTSILIPFLRDWALTVLIEGVVLWFALSPVHGTGTRVLAAIWLSTCTLPIVQFVFPLLGFAGWTRDAWLAGAEVFAPIAECLLFALLIAAPARTAQRATWRDYAAITAANVVSFAVGEVLAGLGLR